MNRTYGEPKVTVDPESRIVTIGLDSGVRNGQVLGSQIYDPDTATFICEGDWKRVNGTPAEIAVKLPAEKGHYHAYVSPVDPDGGWDYQKGQPFVLIDATVEGGRAVLNEAGIVTLRSLRWKNRRRSIGKLFTLPFQTVVRNRSLIRSMVRREILSRYRGSFGDVLWTVLNPLLLMATYFFVFGIVLQSRFGADTSRSGFVLYFLAGMLPWLAFSEAVGRSPQVILEHRNFVKKLVFPVETLPVNQVIAGLVTEAFALLVFILALLVFRGSIPLTVAVLPVLLIPQTLFTMGICWFLSALGVFMRDLSQMIGFVLTLWFFLTPICYPETALPSQATTILGKNPMYTLVRGYRAIFLESQLPEWHSLWKLWILSAVVFFAGHAWFYKLRRTFADVV